MNKPLSGFYCEMAGCARKQSVLIKRTGYPKPLLRNTDNTSIGPFTRDRTPSHQELYDPVWSEAMRNLSKKYGISD
jgi:hypothetical protein